MSSCLPGTYDATDVLVRHNRYDEEDCPSTHLRLCFRSWSVRRGFPPAVWCSRPRARAHCFCGRVFSGLAADGGFENLDHVLIAALPCMAKGGVAAAIL